jgi:hypothetical protein
MYAFGHDEVAPLSKTALDPRNGWGATIIDAMSTMASPAHTYKACRLTNTRALLANHRTDRRLTPCTSGSCFLTRLLQSYLDEALGFVQNVDFSRSKTPDTVRYDRGHTPKAAHNTALHFARIYLAST